MSLQKSYEGVKMGLVNERAYWKMVLSFRMCFLE